MAISAFKTHALDVISRVTTCKTTVVITKRGKPVARVIPYEDDDIVAKPGRLVSVLVSQGDIVSPVDDEWEATR